MRQHLGWISKAAHVSPDVAALRCAHHALDDFGQIDPVLRQLLYVNAGHGPALLFRRNTNRVTRLENSGTALGLSPGTAYQQRVLSMEPGDVLVAFTESMANDAHNPPLDQVTIDTLRNYPNASSSDGLARRSSLTMIRNGVREVECAMPAS